MSEERNGERQEEILRGHLEECFRHFGKSLKLRAPKGSSEAPQVRKPVADFCGVTIASVARWLREDGQFSVGEPVIRLMCFLDMVGYRVIELERMPRVQRNFAELIGFGLLSSKQATDFLGYTSTSTLYNIMQGHHGVSREKKQKMWDIWKSRRRELEQRKRQALELYRLSVSPESFQKAGEDGSEVLPPGQLAVIRITEGLLSLLEGYPFERFSERDFANLRNHAEMFLRLSALLSVLGAKLSGYEEKGDS